MSTNNTHRAAAWWHARPWWAKTLIVIGAAYVAAMLVLALAAVTASAYTKTDLQNATMVDSSGATTSLDKTGNVTVFAAGGSCPAGTGVHGSITSRRTLYLRGTSVVLAKVAVTQEYWCWSSTRITGWGAVYRSSYHFPGYCWDGMDTVDAWWSPWWERKAYTTGSIGIPTPWGCQGIRTLTAKAYYQGDSNHPGTWNRG